MSESFEITLSKSLAPEDLVASIAALLPPGQRVDVGRRIEDLSNEPGSIWAVIGATHDPENWPARFICMVCREEYGLGRYPDLRIASYLARRFGVDALCCTYDFAGDLDPQDPYWSLACIGGTWFLASTYGTRLMGPYTDGVNRFPGNASVRLFRPIEMPSEVLG